MPSSWFWLLAFSQGQQTVGFLSQGIDKNEILNVKKWGGKDYIFPEINSKFQMGILISENCWEYFVENWDGGKGRIRPIFN